MFTTPDFIPLTSRKHSALFQRIFTDLILTHTLPIQNI